jgi:putative membrane protein
VRLSLLITLPLTVVLVVFAIANRGDASISLWPLPIALDLPIFLLVLGPLALGLFSGLAWLWAPLALARRRARKAEARVAALEAKPAVFSVPTLPDPTV